MNATARWFFVPISAVAVWYTVIFLGIGGIGVLDWMCPPDRMVSDVCTADWHAPAVDAWMLVCVAIAATGIVLVPSRMAPSHRFRVAAAAYATGAAFATWAAQHGTLWAPFCVAGVSGGAALWLVWRGAKSPSPSAMPC